MGCEHERFGDVQVWTCGNSVAPPCASCGATSVGSCQAELRGSKAGTNCGRHVCARCNDGTRQAPLCGPHARIARGR